MPLAMDILGQLCAPRPHHGTWYVIGNRLVTVIGLVPIHVERFICIGHGRTRPNICMVFGHGHGSHTR